jgi:ADP-ribose pyrophosphatase
MSQPPATSVSSLGAEVQIARRDIHIGKVISLRVDDVRLPNGNVASREVVMHPGGVVVAPILPDGRLVFVEQFRYPLGRTLLELPAGKLDGGEDPLRAVQRELWEETGYRAEHWEELTYIYTAPGFCDEILWLYRATGLTHDPNYQGDADEDICVRLLSLAEALEKVQRREIVDGKTLALLSLCS